MITWLWEKHSITVLEVLDHDQDLATDYLYDLEQVSRLFCDKHLSFINGIYNHPLDVCSCIYHADSMPNTSHDCPPRSHN